MDCSQRLVKVEVDPDTREVSEQLEVLDEIGWFRKVEIDPVLPVFLVYVVTLDVLPVFLVVTLDVLPVFLEVTLDIELALRLSRVTHSDISSDDNIDRVSADKSD